jgi:hypothetical protein
MSPLVESRAINGTRETAFPEMQPPAPCFFALGSPATPWGKTSHEPIAIWPNGFLALNFWV